MLKNYICLGLAFVVFAISIHVLNTYEKAQDFIIPFSFGIVITAFFYMAGLDYEARKERVYKRIIRNKNKQIKVLKGD